VETRQRGIYQVRLYHLDLAVAGRFVLPAHLGFDSKRDIVSAEATLLLGVSDPRGVDNDPVVNLGGKRYRFATPKISAQDGDALAGQRLAIPLGALALDAATTLDFDFPLQLTGTERLAIAPTAEANTIAIKSDWRHPSFGGRFLPRERTIADDGFTARWEVSHLARSFPNTLVAAKGGPITRSARYPLHRSGQRLSAIRAGREIRHPVHYADLRRFLPQRDPASFADSPVAVPAGRSRIGGLLPAADRALRAPALRCRLQHRRNGLYRLIGTYLAAALGNRRQGFSFAAALAGLYGVLYGVLLSEDNSLLMGSVLLFLALGAIMLATRRIDWYQIGPALAARPAE
jgi:inner membrane protein